MTRLTDLFGHGQALGVGDGGQLLLLQLLNGVLVIPQVQLGAHQDDGCVGAVVTHLRVPLDRGQADGRKVRSVQRRQRNHKTSTVSHRRDMKPTTTGAMASP